MVNIDTHKLSGKQCLFSMPLFDIAMRKGSAKAILTNAIELSVLVAVVIPIWLV